MSRLTGDERILVTIPISHFCEKARWALERAGLACEEERHIQLVHQVAVRRAGGGRTAPALKTSAGTFSQSADILRYVDDHTPADRRLYPEDPGERARVEELEERYFAPWNLTGVPGWERRVFPFVVGPAKVIIRRKFDITAASAAEARRLVDEEFDAVGELLSDGWRFLVGERFSAADLAFAAPAAPAICPPHYGTPLPQPADLPDDMAAAVRGWREHPAGQVGMRMFREERAALAAA